MSSKFMKAVEVVNHGGRDDFDTILRLSNQVPRPVRTKGHLLLRVRACSLAPGDVRVLSGRTKLVQNPNGGKLPYVPGGDVTGVVVESDPDRPNDFEVGDEVIARFDQPPHGGLAEYYAAKTSLCVRRPSWMGLSEASAVPASVAVAYVLIQKFVREGDRVLVLGATGGVGSHAIQLVRSAGASYVAATARDLGRLEATGARVDRPINYVEEDWWELDDFRKEEGKLDLILDFSGFTPNSWKKGRAILKPASRGGRFVTTVGDNVEYDVLGIRDVLKLVKVMNLRPQWTNLFHYSRPSYLWSVDGLAEPTKDMWDGLFATIKRGDLRVMIDPTGPFPFTEQGVRDAFRLQQSKHAFGKVVIVMDDCAESQPLLIEGNSELGKPASQA